MSQPEPASLIANECAPLPPFFEPGRLEAAAAFARAFHAPTPLRELPAQAARLGISALLVKDESGLLGLGSFKARGALWAMANILAAQMGLKPGFRPEDLRPARSNLFITATDGNHGRAVAFAARHFGQKAAIFMPEGASPAQVAAIKALGAACEVLAVDYDAAVEHASARAAQEGAILIQDTAWEGYEEIPGLIMEGYGALALELAAQSGPPGHVFLQAGVGSFAAAMLAALAPLWPRSRFICLEPQRADCVFRSILAGESRPAGGDLSTIMAGLSCGRVSSLAWPILKAGLCAAASIPDEMALAGMSLLARPLKDDPAISAGESGAPGAGLLEWLMLAPEAARFREMLRLDEKSRVLLICTEGRTNITVRP